MFEAQARWLLIAGLSATTLVACGDDATPDPGGSAGSGATSGSAGSPQGGSASGGGGSSSTAGTPSTSGSGGGSTAGSGGAATGGSAGASTAGGGGGAGTSGSGGAGGSGGAAAPTAVANIMGVGEGAGKVVGTATFTQGATMTTLVLDLTVCPDGVHSSHLHETKNCGDNGNAAGGHWQHGEMLGDYTCANGKVTKEVSKGLDKWTVGDGGEFDVTKHSFMVHATGDAQGSGARIGCGLVEKK